MNPDAAHHSGWKTAHSIFGLILILGLLLHLYWPLSLSSYIGFRYFEYAKYLGTPLMLIGMFIIIYSKRELAIHDQPSHPKAATTLIVQTGMFRFSRNPLYLGLLIAFCGLVLAIDKLWGLILLPLAIGLTYYLLIFPEEAYLERKFSDDYRAYKNKVRRWI